MRDKKKAHKLRCVDASLDKRKQLIMRASMCVCVGSRKGQRDNVAFKNGHREYKWTILAKVTCHIHAWPPGMGLTGIVRR